MQICHLAVIPCIFRGFDFASGIHYLTHSHTFLSFFPVVSLLSLWPLGWLFISNGYLFWDSHICQAHTSCQYHTTVLWMGRIPKCYSPPPISIPCLLLLIQHPGFPFQYLSSFIPSPLASPLLCMGFLSFLSVLGLHPLQVFSAMFRPPHCTWPLLKCDPFTPSLASISANITENLQMTSTSKGQRVFFSGPLLPPKITLSHKGHKWRAAYFPLSCF